VTAFVEQLEALVRAESPSHDLDACRRCAEVAGDIGASLLGDPPARVDLGGRVNLVWRFGDATRVLLVGHLDTVWPIGTIESWPFMVHGSTATGPGAFDMKLGVVQLLTAAARVNRPGGLTIVLNTDEEIGSLDSRALITELAAEARAAFVFEPSADGALKTSRKGIARLTVTCLGSASHAGLDPYVGANAVTELAHQVVRLAELDRAITTATITPTRTIGGQTNNTVPDHASAHVDVRFESEAALDWLRARLSELQPVLSGTEVTYDLHVTRPPFAPALSAYLFAEAQRIAASLGIPLEGSAVGGGSDGNLTAAMGTPTLDGLGAVGGKAHARGEWVDLTAFESRVQLSAALIEQALEGREATGATSYD
jgi:glutamate carboxypeptidase